MKLKTGFAGLASVTMLAVSMQAAAIANPFGNVMNSVNEVNETVNDVNDTVESVEQVVQTFDTLSNLLGMDTGFRSSISDSDPTGQIMELYGAWFTDLSSPEQAIAAQLFTEYAGNQNTSLDIISASSWFLQKPTAEQSQVSDTFGKIQGLLEATGQDSSRFLGYASCVSGGTSSCAI